MARIKPLFSNIELLAIPRTEGVMIDINQKGQNAVRANYTTLRDIAQKRLKRAQAAGYMTDKEPFAKLSDIKDKRDLAAEYANISRFLLSPDSTAEGREKRNEKAVARLNARGIDFVNKKNVADFGKFLGVMREIYSQEQPGGAKALYIDSDDLADYYSAMRESTHSKIRDLYRDRHKLGKDAAGRDDPELDPETKRARDSVKRAFEKWKKKRR